MKFMSNVKVILWVTVVCLYVGLRPGITEAQGTIGIPELFAPMDGAVTTGATDPPVGVPALAWMAVAGATKYNVQVSLSAGFASPVIDVTTYGLSFTPLTALADGGYFWR